MDTNAQILREIILRMQWSRADAAALLHCSVMSIGRYLKQAEFDDQSCDLYLALGHTNGPPIKPEMRTPSDARVHLANILAAAEGRPV